MNTRKSVLFVAFVLFVIAYVASDPLMFGLCRNVEVYNETMKRCVDGTLLPEYISQLIGFLSAIFLVLSLITYRMKEEVFRAWWRFAWWWSLIIVAATVGLNNAGGGGTLRLDQDFTILILSILYAVLIVSSLVKIVRTYLRTR